MEWWGDGGGGMARWVYRRVDGGRIKELVDRRVDNQDTHKDMTIDMHVYSRRDIDVEYKSNNSIGIPGI